jgi:aconitase A
METLENELANISKDCLAKMKELKLQSKKKKLLLLIENEKYYNLKNQELQNDFDIALAIAKKTPEEIRSKIKKWKNNKEIVLIVVKDWGTLLEYASEELRGDREVVLTAIRSCQHTSWSALQYASEELRNDKEVVLEALQKQFKFSVSSYPCEVMQYLGNELGKELLELAIEHLKK